LVWDWGQLEHKREGRAMDYRIQKIKCFFGLHNWMNFLCPVTLEYRGKQCKCCGTERKGDK